MKKTKPLIWLHGEIKTPPFSKSARLEAGILLRQLQHGQKISLPHSRPMPSIGRDCHELRIKDENKDWRIIYKIDIDAVVILEIFQKQSNKTPQRLIDTCKKRLNIYNNLKM